MLMAWLTWLMVMAGAGVGAMGEMWPDAQTPTAPEFRAADDGDPQDAYRAGGSGGGF